MKNKKFFKFLIYLFSIVGILVIIALVVWFSTSSIRIKTSEDYQADASELLEKEEYNDAVLALNKALFFNPSNDEAWYELGEIHRSFQEYNLSEKCFGRAWKIKKSDEYLLTYIESLFKNQKFSDANRIFLNSERSDVTKMILWMISARDQNYSDSKEWAQKITEPINKYYYLALTDLLSEDYDSFADNLKHIKASQDETNIPGFIIWKLYPDADAIKSLKKAETSILASEIAESKKLFGHQAITELGFGFLITDQVEELIADNLNWRDAYLVLGEIYYLEEDYTKALEELKSAEKLDYNYLPILKLIHKTYLALDQADKVEDYALRIEKLQFEN